MSARTFSARRSPDRVHSDVYKCRACGMVFSNPVPSADDLRVLYGGGAFTYQDLVPGLKKTYGRYLRRAAAVLGRKGRLLEIGCGSGFLLEEALDQGFDEVRGVETGEDAVKGASPRVKDSIARGWFDASLFTGHAFDLVCAFQVIDHMADPNGFLRDVARVLRPGGAVLFLQHDAGAWSAGLLGEKSPIIDIEHPYLYDGKTLPAILAKNGFRTIDVFRAWNVVPLRYLVHLAPLPGVLKRPLLGCLDLTRLGRLPIKVPLGNFGVVAVRVEETI